MSTLTPNAGGMGLRKRPGCKSRFTGMDGPRTGATLTLEWTSDQILKLAPDPASAKAGRDLASARRWVSLGCDDQSCWGECQGSGSVPYQAQIDLSEPAFRCSCPSRKFPCKHALGLFLLYADQRASWQASARPAWVEEWLASRAKKAEQRSKKAEAAAEGGTATVVDTAAQARRSADREAKVAAGLEELKLWLLDLVRQGLATAQGRPYSFWESAAARMIDAQAPGIARMVRDLAGIPASGEGWPERLLERLGRLLLLIEGFQRITALPEPAQAEIRSQIGWTQDQKELLSRPGVRDRWLVLGRRVEAEDRLTVQRTWLWGQSTRRRALVLHFAAFNQPLDVSLVPGTLLDLELVFFPAALPLRALVKERMIPPTGIESFGGERSLAEAIAGYGDALASNPWLERFPMVLEDMIPFHHEDRWFIRDLDNARLTVSPRSDQGWRLLACSGGRPIGLFGEYDGDTLRPLSLWNENGFHLLPELE